MKYLDFDLEIGPGEEREYTVSVLRSPAGEARETMKFPFDEVKLRLHLVELENALLRSATTRRIASTKAEKEVQEFGSALFNAVLINEIRNRFDVSLERAQALDMGLRVKLRITAPDLAALPWEFLHDPRRGEYLCFSRQTPIVRYPTLPFSTKPLVIEPPLRILGMVSSPRNLPQLDISLEKERLQQPLHKLQQAGLIELHWLEGQTGRDLQRIMHSGPWHVFHFIGHGGFDASREEGFLALCDERGEREDIRATHLARLLADYKSMRLVVLNACEGARSSQQDVFSSTASILLRGGVPAVLAMQYAITDRAAVEFSRVFYESLADGLPVDTAVVEGRVAISLAFADTMEWGTPILYLRAEDGVLFDMHKKDVLIHQPAEEQTTFTLSHQDPLKDSSIHKPDTENIPDDLHHRFSPAISSENVSNNISKKSHEKSSSIQGQSGGVKSGQLLTKTSPSHAHYKNNKFAIWLGFIAIFLAFIVFIILQTNNFLSIPAPTEISAPLLLFSQTSTTVESNSENTPEPATLPSITSSQTPTLVFSTPSPTIMPVIAVSNASQVGFLTRFWGKGVPNYATWSPDGRIFAVATSLGIYVYNANTFDELLFIDRIYWIYNLAVSPDGSILAAGLGSHLELWNSSDGSLLQKLEGHTGRIFFVAFSPDGQTLVSGSEDKTVRLWRVSDGQLLQTMQGHTDRIVVVTYSPNGQIIASGSWDKTIRLWNATDGELVQIFQGHDDKVLSLTFDPSGQLLASGSNDNKIHLWKVDDGSILRTLQGHVSGITSLTFSPDGETLASGSNDMTIRLWNVPDGSQNSVLEGHHYFVNNVIFSPDGNLLASTSGDGKIRFWSVPDRKTLSILELSSGIMNMALSLHGDTLAFGTNDINIQLFDFPTGNPKYDLEGHITRAYSVDFSPDGKIVASGAADGTIRLWRISDGSLLRTLDGHTSLVNALSFSPDGHKLASGSEDKMVRVWTVEDGSLLFALEGHKDGVLSIDFSPDGQFIASGSKDNTIGLWDVSTGTLLNFLEGHTDKVNFAVYDPNGLSLASGSHDKTVRLWLINDGSLTQTIDFDAPVTSATYSLDGTLLAVGTSNARIYIWQLPEKLLVNTLSRQNSASITGLAFSPDGRYLVSGSSDSTAGIWTVFP